MNGDWDPLLEFFPPGREGLAAGSGALKGLRRDRSAENPLRTLPLHPGCGHSLRGTALRSRRDGLAGLSPVALRKRVARSGPWPLSPGNCILKLTNTTCCVLSIKICASIPLYGML